MLLLPSFLSPTFLRSLGGRLERAERMAPETIEIRTQRFQAGGVHRIDATSSFCALGDEAGVLEHTQVLGDGGTTDREVACQLTHGARALHETGEDRATSAIAQSIPWTECVSDH